MRLDERRGKPHLSRVLSLLVAALVPVALLPSASASPARGVGPYTAATPAAVPESVSIAAAGDIACEPAYCPTATTCRHAGTAAMISRRGVDAVLTPGDNHYERGILYDFQHFYDPTWGAFKAKTRPTPGNHEYNTAGADGYYDYFGAAAHRPTSGYYGYNVGAWRMYALNSNCDEIDCAAELEWLRHDLAANPTRCSLVAMHHPRFSSGVHGDSELWAGMFWTVDRSTWRWPVTTTTTNASRRCRRSGRGRGKASGPGSSAPAARSSATSGARTPAPEFAATCVPACSS
jgi:hypothetical protein